MLNEARDLLRQHTGLNHTAVNDDEDPDVLDNIELSILPEAEKERFRKLKDEDLPDARIKQIFANWAAYEVTIDDTRMASEEQFSRAELRLDRLERIIREERIINDRRTLDQRRSQIRR